MPLQANQRGARRWPTQKLGLERSLHQSDMNHDRDKTFLFYFSSVTDVKKCITLTLGERFRNSSERENFGDSLLEMDDSIGQVVSAIRKSGKLNNTIIVFTSDNG